ncbi:MAG: hypothetical protein M1822_006296 [Bathelium mastoideum]|nr:MAG: hypothetical protein M1822_006296 [Bathelium mastoideum]
MTSMAVHRHNLFKRDLLLCFDAFGTLFTPKAPIAEQYGEVARRHGLSGFSDAQVQDAFKKAFKEESKERPNYGKAFGMAAPEWWGNIIKKVFYPFLRDDAFPPGLVPDLLTRFSSKDGYKLYPDVLPLFEKLRKIRYQYQSDPEGWPWRRTTVGIITNSDDRVPSILESFGLRVGPRFCPNVSSLRTDPEAEVDIDFVVVSYDVGKEKPHPDIFHAARSAVRLIAKDQDEEDLTTLCVGDEVSKDAIGSIKAGWEAVLLDRDSVYQGSERGILANVQEIAGEYFDEPSFTIARDMTVIGPRLRDIWQEPNEILPLKIPIP